MSTENGGSKTQQENDCIWLEVSNVCLDTGGTAPEVKVQLKGDRNTPGPQWWTVDESALTGSATVAVGEIFRALDSKRIVLAGLGAGEKDKWLRCRLLRIQFSEARLAT